MSESDQHWRCASSSPHPEQQRETATLGMWIFLITEVMLFGGLFTAFSVYRIYYTLAFDQGQRRHGTSCLAPSILPS